MSSISPPDFLNKFFTYDKYKRSASPLVDASDSYANMGMVISFLHVPSGQEVYFKAFITAFNESYDCSWNKEPIYGRSDPVRLYAGTSRSITLNFKIPAASESEAYENLGKVQKLTQFLYPTYVPVAKNAEGTLTQKTIGQSPYIRMKVMNLLQTNKEFDSLADQGDMSREDLYDQYKSHNWAELGLLGIVESFQVNHNLENDDANVLVVHSDELVSQGNRTIDGQQVEVFTAARGVKGNTVLPTLIDVALTFNAIHEHPIGWKKMRSESRDKQSIEDKGTRSINSGFPYGVRLRESQAQDTSTGFDERVANYNAELKKRELMQQAIDNAKARYKDTLWGGLNTKAMAKDRKSGTDLGAATADVGDQMMKGELEEWADLYDLDL